MHAFVQKRLDVLNRMREPGVGTTVVWNRHGEGSVEESACQYRTHGFGLWVEIALEKEMATHSSILAWELPWTEEPGGLQSIGLQRVRHYWVTEHTHTSRHESHLVCNSELIQVSPPLPTEAGRWAPSSGVGGNSPLAFTCRHPTRGSAPLGMQPWAVGSQCLFMYCLPGCVWMWVVWRDGQVTTVWRGCSFFHRGGGPPGEGCMGPGQSLANKGLLVSADYGTGKKKLLSPAQLKKNLPAMQETWV